MTRMIDSVTPASMELADATRRSASAKKILTICLCLSLIGGCASVHHAVTVSVIASASADVISTEAAKSRGYVEGNPIVSQSLLRHVLLKGVAVSAILAGAQAIENSHKTWAQVIRIVPVILWSAASVSNFSALRSQRAR